MAKLRDGDIMAAAGVHAHGSDVPRVVIARHALVGDLDRVLFQDVEEAFPR